MRVLSVFIFYFRDRDPTEAATTEATARRETTTQKAAASQRGRNTTRKVLDARALY